MAISHEIISKKGEQGSQFKKMHFQGVGKVSRNPTNFFS